MTETTHIIEEVESIVIRFAGDSGDGMQLTGTQFTNTSAIFGNDISTMPDFPAEIHAPAGTLAGVSGFQVHFSAADILTPGDAPQVLISMNPAALKASLSELERGGVIILNTDAFTKQNLAKAGYKTNPLEDGSLAGYQVMAVPMTTMNRGAVEVFDELSNKEKDRSQNSFALGLIFWNVRPYHGDDQKSGSRKSLPSARISPRPTSKPWRRAIFSAKPPKRSNGAIMCARLRWRPAPTAK